MMFRCMVIAVLLAITLFGQGVLSAATNFISGQVTATTNWSGTNVLQGTVVIQPGVTVTIEPGARMYMMAGTTLRVEGQLLAEGLATNQILFTRQAVGARWERIRFSNAEDSVLRYCIFEFANCSGDHLSYYDNDCNPGTRPPTRTYREAIVAISTHLDIQGCLFRNLPDNSGSGEGDAIAIISDDPDVAGASSAHIWDCQFTGIGQGIHSRFSYILVENCFFTQHHGDNDDIDMYGESVPVPMIRYNVFLNPAHDDMINPTRCSAIIMGNVISGGDDHGIVLRDQCSPIVMNNVIFNCAAAGIAVQNQCDALLINNTIINSARGIRFFDHDGRWNAPYCLSPGSGRATIINSIIWDCTTSFDLANSPYTGDRGSHARVIHCNVEGGQASAVVSSMSTLMWGPGNINADPRFTNTYRLRAGSPAIDAGTNPAVAISNLVFALTNDVDFNPRPLDGNGDGIARFDIGAIEFLLPSADSNQDGIPDGWTLRYGLDPTDPNLGVGNPDGDPQNTHAEWVADTNPTNALSFFQIATLSNGPPWAVHFPSSSNRQYTLYSSTDLSGTNSLQAVPGQINIPGSGTWHTLSDETAGEKKFYRIGVSAPQ